MARSRSLTAALSQLLSQVKSPVYAIDERRIIVYVNAALADWLDIAEEEIAGHRVDYHTPAAAGSRAAQLAAALCPPPEIFTGISRSAIVCCPLSNGGNSTRQVLFVPLGQAGPTSEGVIGVVESAEYVADDAAASGFDAAQLHLQLQAMRRDAAARYGLESLAGESAAMQRVRRQAVLGIEAPARTLIVGPEGSGRQHIAKVMHYAGDAERAPPLMPLACALLDAELLQTSITAFVRRAARVKSPRPAAVLLLDADQLSPAAQTELAGFLNLPGFDLHILSTARAPLTRLADEGKFRADLALALATLVLEVPPLSSRPEDIPLLAQMFVEAENAAGKLQRSGLASEAIEALCFYPWPQNAAELREVIAQAHRQAGGPTITLDDLPEHIRLAPQLHVRGKTPEEPIALDEFLSQIERELIARALARAKGNKTKAAELLGITRPRLHRRMEQLGVEG